MEKSFGEDECAKRPHSLRMRTTKNVEMWFFYWNCSKQEIFEMKKYVEGTGEWQKVDELLENFISLLYCVIGKIPVSLQFTMK